MSPAAVEFQSPFSMKPSSSIQTPTVNPNSNPFSSTSDQSQNQSHSSNSNNSIGLENANEFDFGTGFGVRNGSSFFQHTGSRVWSGRPRAARLAKVRKHSGKSKTSGSDRGSGLDFNPFRSTGEDSGLLNNFSGNSSFSTSNRDCKEPSVSHDVCIVNNEHVGFVFGAKVSNVGRDFNLEGRDTSECTVKSGSGGEEKMKLKNEEERGNDRDATFQFGANRNDLCLNLNLEKEELSETLKNPASNQLFGINQNDSGSSSNFETSECNGDADDSGLGFVFGASWCDSASNSNLKRSDLIQNNGKTVSDDQGKMKVESKMESQKMKANKARFNCDGSLCWSEEYGEFGSDNKKSSCFDDCGTLNCLNEMKLNSKSFQNDGIGKTENGNLNFEVNHKGNFESETTGSNIGSASITDPLFKLPDAIKKLSIYESENDAGTDKKYDSNRNSCTCADTTFVLRSSVKASSSCKVNTAAQGNLAAEQVSLSSGGLKSQQNDNVPETPSMVGVQNNDENSPTNSPKGLGVSFTDFVTPIWDPTFFKASLYPDLSRKLEFSVKSRSIKDKKSKRTKGKLKKPSFLKKEMKQVHIQKQSSSQESPNSPECYSPMDFSPYMESTMSDRPSGQTCVTSKESFQLGDSFEPSTSHSSVTIDVKDGNFAIAEKNDINITDQNFRESNQESPWKGFDFGSEAAYSSFKEEHVDGLNTESHESMPYCFCSGVVDLKYFTFATSSSAEGGLTSRKCQLRKKNNNKKVGNKSSVIAPSPKVKDNSSSVEFSHHAKSSAFNTVSEQEESKYISKSKVQNKVEVAEQVKKGSVSSTAAFQETWEMWRLRGNQSYKDGNLSKAEDFYTQGINSVPLSETAGCCIKPLVLCYSNRATTRIALGRMRDALDDCMIAITVDPNFLKVYLRAANCHLVLGEVENALQYYNKLLESGAEVCLDRRITIEAADGLQKAQKVAEWTNHSAKLLEQKTSEAASNALEIIAEALSISSCSEKLLELKAEALCMLQRYEEAVQLCEQTLGVAEKNFVSMVTDNCSANMNASGSVNHSFARLWRWHLISKSYFFMGKLEMALNLLQKLEQVGSIRECGSEILESSISLAATIRELLHCKNAGNEAVRSGRYSEAVEHYTVALSNNIESRPFAAICFCNRAAALQGLGQIADAIADCSVSMALDANYTKAVSRRAALHEMIRDYAQAASDFQRLISILESQSAEKAKQSGSPARSTGSKDIRQSRRHMSAMAEAAKNEASLDFYLILGVKASDTTADIKKAYRKAALKHHPDKAGQFLARTEIGDEGQLWKEIAHEVHKDADRLFKIIGEAYAVLSDTTKRSEYDLEEELRKATKESPRSSHCKKSSDAYNYSSRRSANRQNWQENWKTYGNSYSRW